MGMGAGAKVPVAMVVSGIEMIPEASVGTSPSGAQTVLVTVTVSISRVHKSVYCAVDLSMP